MKTLIKQSLIVALMTATLTSYASSVESLVKVVGEESKAFTLVMNEADYQQVQIFIKDENGVTLYKEKLDITSTYYKRFDLQALPTGHYALEIADDMKIKVMPFEVSKKEMHFSKSEEFEIFKPWLRTRGMHVDVMLIRSQRKSTWIQIYDEQGNLLHRLKVPAGQNVEKIFDFSNHPQGTYTFSFLRGGRTFDEEVTLGQ